MARTIAQNTSMRDARREQILTAALRVFSEKGLAATRISDIATASAISQGLLYHYFPSKEDIYAELVRTAITRMHDAAVGLARRKGSPAAKILMALTELVRMLEGREDVARYFMLTAQASFSSAVPPAVTALIRSQRLGPYRSMARIFRAGQRDGSIRRHDADELAVVFWTMIKGLAMQRAAFGKAFKAPDPHFLATIFLSDHST
jgi:AcrR family transcriptional regulator